MDEGKRRSLSGALFRLALGLIGGSMLLIAVIGAGTRAFAPDDTVLFTAEDAARNWDLFALDPPRALHTRLTHDAAWDGMGAWSPDRQRIAFASGREGTIELYVMQRDGRDVRRVTHDRARQADPAWSPDGTRLVYAADTDGNWDVYTLDLADGTIERLTDHPAEDQSPVWSPNGERIAFVSYRQDNYGIYTVQADGGTARELIFNGRWRAIAPAWSPDGRWLAFASDGNETRNFEIYVTPMARGDLVPIQHREARRLTTHPNSDVSPTWTADGRAIIFASWRGDGSHLYRVDLADETTIALPAGVSDESDPN